ncbi:unnamed protein product, partial [Porites evermanni]
TLTSVEIRGLINDCLHSRASSTVAKYIREVRKFINFQEINSRPLLFPANVAHLALYLSMLLRKDSKTAVLSAYSALKWIHGFIPVQFNPLDFTICRNLKEPVDLDMIKSIINNYASSDCSLKDLQFATMSTLLYVGLFRSQELLDMKLCDLDVTDTYLEVRYDQSLYGLHTFRSGGATSLTHTLENNPSKERLLKLHGRWKTDLEKDMYIKESVDQRLSFVKNLGL